MTTAATSSSLTSQLLGRHPTEGVFEDLKEVQRRARMRHRFDNGCVGADDVVDGDGQAVGSCGAQDGQSASAFAGGADLGNSSVFP